ncbi:MAG: hypothetical protein QM500_05730 [Methylococcales bacterium]
MEDNQKSLASYTLKLSNTAYSELKVICARHEKFQYLYELNDEVIHWALEQASLLVALAPYKGEGKYRPYYVSNKSVGKITNLAKKLQCNDTRAVYTALEYYLNNNTEIFNKIIKS